MAVRNRNPRRQRWKRVLLIASGLAIAYIGGCYWLATQYVSQSHFAITPPEGFQAGRVARRAGEIPIWHSLDGEAQPKPTVFVLVHGLGGSPRGWSELMNDLKERGAEVVVPTMPGHADSPDRRVGFGRKEAAVLVDTVSWIRSQYKADRPTVVLVGVSMGGAASWIASETADVDAVVTEGAFAHLDETVDRFFDRALPGGRYVFAPVRFFASQMTGVDPREVNPIESAKKWRGKPALIIQCSEDSLIARSHAVRLGEALTCEPWIIEGAAHAQGSSEAGAEYVQRLLDIAQEAEGKKAQPEGSMALP